MAEPVRAPLHRPAVEESSRGSARRAPATARQGHRAARRGGGAQREPCDDMGAAGFRRLRRHAEAPRRFRPSLRAQRRQGGVAVAGRRELEHGHAPSRGMAAAAGRFRRARPPPFRARPFRQPGRYMRRRPGECGTDGGRPRRRGPLLQPAPRRAAGPPRRRDPPARRSRRCRALGPRRRHRLFEARHRRRAGRDGPAAPAPPGAPATACHRGLLRRLGPRRLRRAQRARRRPFRRHGDAARWAAPSADYLLLEYRGGDRLYLPSEQIDAITPYTGGESPALNRMGGAEWSRQKARVRAAVREVAKELVELYRRRQTTPGHASRPTRPGRASSSRPSRTRRPRTS